MKINKKPLKSKVGTEQVRNTLGRDLGYVIRLFGRYIKADPMWCLLLFGGQIGAGAVGAILGLQLQRRLAEITNALGNGDGSQIAVHTSAIIWLTAAITTIGVVAIFAMYTLQIRFRRVVNGKLVSQWITDDRFYHMERQQKLDYPEQRIQEDISLTVNTFLRLAPEVTIGSLTVFLYIGQLWNMSPPISIPVLGITKPIPGFLVFCTLGFAVGMTLITHWIGIRLTNAEIARQTLEARYRQQMAAVRHNGETIAFTRGGEVERSRVEKTFELIRLNWASYVNATIAVRTITGLPMSMLMIAPTLIFAPFVLSGAMGIGDVNLIGVSIMSVYVGAGILMSNYVALALLRSSVARLRRLEEVLGEQQVIGINLGSEDRADIQLENLSVAFPNGQAMNTVGDLAIRQGDRLLIKGRSGAGKSTLLRAIAGLWPEGSGQVRVPADANIVFLPQRPYLPAGTIADLLAYPNRSDVARYPVYEDILRRLGLERLVPFMDEHAVWSNSLSLGEQQRIAAARAILSEPDYLFVDEATSALDARLEADVYALMEERLPNSAIISVAHRPAVERYHSKTLEIDAGRSTATAY